MPSIRETRESLLSTFAALSGFRADIPGDRPPSAVSGAVYYAARATYYGGYLYGPTTINSYIEWSFWAPAGTYSLDVYYSKAPGTGIASISIDGAAALGTTIDLYNSTETHYHSTSITGVTVATSGAHTIRFTYASKNASSSGYATTINGIRVIRTGT